MKKYIYIFIIVMLGISVAYAQNSSKFVDALSNCSAYSEAGIVNSEGVNVNSQKKILGRNGDKCVYQEKISFAENNLTITCSFSQSQISEIVNVMRAYDTVQSYSNETVDVSGYSAVQNNPVVKVWNKYLMDTSVCSIK